MPALRQLRLQAGAAGRAAYPAPAGFILSWPGTHACRLSSISPPSSINAAEPYAYANNKTATSRLANQPIANMSTMPASHGHNEACCNIPPVVSKGYSAKGFYHEVDGLKTCKSPLH